MDSTTATQILELAKYSPFFAAAAAFLFFVVKPLVAPVLVWVKERAEARSKRQAELEDARAKREAARDAFLEGLVQSNNAALVAQGEKFTAELAAQRHEMTAAIAQTNTAVERLTAAIAKIEEKGTAHAA